MRLFCDCKTDEEKSNFFLSGRAVETGVIAPAISNEVAMAYHRCAQLKKENDALRARIEAMEQQEPVATVRINAINGNPSVDFVPDHRYLHHNDKLYLAPGAQNVPVEQDASVRKAWSRFSNELHRSPDAPYPGMSEAFERHFSQSFTDREWRAESGTWAAAWKAAKRHEAQAQPAPSVPTDSIGKLLTQAMDVAVANGANSVSMPDELVEVAAWLAAAPKPEAKP